MKYHLARGEEQLGTFTDLDVTAGLRNGRFQPSDLCWTEGMADWKPLGEHMKELATEAGLDEPPPPPPTMEAQELRRAEERALRRYLIGLRLAPLTRRFGAAFFDQLTYLLPAGGIVSLVIDESFTKAIAGHQNEQQFVLDLLAKRLQSLLETGSPQASTALFLFGTMAAIWLLNAILLTRRGQTLGKVLMGTQVVLAADGGRPGFFRAVALRSLFFSFVSNVPIIGPIFAMTDILMIFRSDRRCLHDHVADTVVVMKVRKSADS